MTFAAPGVLALGAAAIAVLVALHFFARRRPRAVVLPTARFVPERATRLLSRTLALTDAWLLLLRALAVAALALAFARPTWSPRRAPVARLLLVDRSRDVASEGELRDSVRAVATPGATIVVFDSAARRLTSAPDSIRLTGAPGSFSTAFVAALRAGAELAPRADSVELVIVSPFAERERDAATNAIAAAWPGRVRAVPIALRRADSTSHAIAIRAATGDAVAAAASLGVRSLAAVRLVRDSATAADRAWVAAPPAAAAAGANATAAAAGAANTNAAGAPATTAGAAATPARRVLVVWPSAGRASSRVPRPGAVVAGAATVVAPFDAARSPAPGTVVARWADGSAAATERAVGEGCIRDVAIPIDERSDLALRPPFRALLTALVAPCGDVAAPRRPADAALAVPTGRGPLASTRALAAPADASPRLAALLLAVGLVLLAIEWLVRRFAARGREMQSA